LRAVAELSPAQRAENADKLEQSIRFVPVAVILGMVLVGVDLVTGAIFDDWRIDLLVLACCALGLWVFLSLRQIAGWVRTNQVPPRPGPGTWVSWTAGSALSVSITAGLGYLIGGLWLAVLLPAAEIVFIAILTARSVRRRRTAD
jgi:hypothetical protein